MNGSSSITDLTPVAENIWIIDGDTPKLLGGKNDSGSVVFPIPDTEAGKAMQAIKLSTTGKLWSFTRQDFRPKSPYDGPEEFTPFLLGYVELAEVIVETHLVDCTLEQLKLGMEMELVIIQFDHARSTYAFKPAK